MAGRVASRSWAWSARRAVIARGMAATGLLSIGVCLGVVVGSLFDGPRLFVRGLALATQRVELPASSVVLELEALEAFGELQREEPPPALEPPPATQPEVASAPRVPAPAPMARPSASKPAPLPELEVAQRVIAEIAARKQPQQTGKVVQVAAYAERPLAEALVERLRKSGFKSYVSDTRPKGQYRFRVRVRSQLGGSVKQLAARLEAQGHAVWITTE